ncbi:uncharacterized membrane protein At1g75140 [Ricinus communis]|uniref:Uncharacterized protein n=1 Tax=Ricinus communis TaxID=3988 RepID=B9R7R8_RICCO|nr:uncharacterized membrane protein At1g75140 [Ricinus communis]EEF52548.1 conserved hypothetical protein [Ricinus communis]|eukprot:XP_002510361.1 uncharacterized membrane protein At1g75140 [Ricinus communis]
MASTHKGKLFSFLYFIFILVAVFINYSRSVPIQQDHDDHHSPYHEPEAETRVVSNPQEVLLRKLEELVRNLSEVVARLETKLSESAKIVPPTAGFRNQEQHRANQINLDAKKSVAKVQEEEIDDKIQDKERARAVPVTKYSPFWSERFQFVSAVKLDSDATCVNVLPSRDFEGFSKYVAVGDDQGRVYVFSRNGDVLIEFYTMSKSPVTAMVSYLSVYKNESVVVTGHQNGVVLVHKVHEMLNGEEWGTLFMETVGKFVPSDLGGEGLPLTLLEVHHVGRSRYILSSDVGGKIRILRENGTVHGSVIPTSRPIAFLKQRLLFLTESGAGSLDLRNMKVRESDCEGLNHSLVRNYVFDATERSKAYGFTSEGNLIHVVLVGDIMNFKCRVRSKRKFDMDEPLTLQAIKGYLLAVNAEKVFAYNVSTQHYVRVGGPRLLFSAGLDEIRSSFLNYQAMDVLTERSSVIPLMASDREKLVVLGLGGGYVGMYRSNLPVFKGEFNTMLWTSPVLFFILFLFGAWQFFAKKKEALTSWGPDDPFSSPAATTGASLGSSSGDRAFADSSSRRDDIMELRSGGLRGPPRRYVSPSRYPGGASGSFRPSSADANSRPTSVDPNYRPSSELKYRGPTLEPTGFPKRRENLYVNNQVVDDSS